MADNTYRSGRFQHWAVHRAIANPSPSGSLHAGLERLNPAGALRPICAHEFPVRSTVHNIVSTKAKFLELRWQVLLLLILYKDMKQPQRWER